MKHLLLTCISLLLCINCLAEEATIQVYKSYPERRFKDRRSITLEPTATIDGNMIHIYTDMTVDNVSIAVKDQSGNIVHTSTDTTSSRCHTFMLYDLPKSEYMLEFTIGDTSYYGYFSCPDDI